MDDKEILALLNERSEMALARVEEKYGKLCYRVAYNILGNDADAKETVNDTYLRLWNAIPPAKPESLKAYIAAVCRRLALDRHEAQTAQKRGSGQLSLALEELEHCLPAGGEDANAQIDLQTVLQRFLGKLPRTTRDIFLRRYFYTDSVRDIARAYGKKEHAVTVLLLRTRQKLKDFLEKEGFDV